jgi:hypothetical protein
MLSATPMSAVIISFNPEMYSGRLLKLVAIITIPNRSALPTPIVLIAAIHPGGGALGSGAFNPILRASTRNMPPKHYVDSVLDVRGSFGVLGCSSPKECEWEDTNGHEDRAVAGQEGNGVHKRFSGAQEHYADSGRDRADGSADP